MFRYMNAAEYQEYVKQLMDEKALYNSAKTLVPCDKCDGPHATSKCPYFNGKVRDNHTDALGEYMRLKKQKKLGTGNHASSLADVLENVRGKVIGQPGDGSCLFHSLSYGLGGGMTAPVLRREIEDYISAHPDEDLNGTAIKKWVEWDSGNTVTTYTGMMRNSSNWGGAIEIAVCAHMKGIQIDVYERNSNGLFKRISSFKPSTAPTNSKSKINVLYGGRCHYDALIIV